MIISHPILDKFTDIEAAGYWLADDVFFWKSNTTNIYQQYESVYQLACTDPNRLVIAEQVHDNGVHICNDAGIQLACDALVTAKPGLVLSIRTADCAAILVYDPVCQVVANIHAGWRGLHQNIIYCTINEMYKKYGSKTSDLVVSVGPFIRKCCYQVGKEFYDLFNAQYLSMRSDQIFLDTEGVLFSQLTQTGVAQNNIEISTSCTFCSPSKLPSFRRTASKNRIIHMIQIKGEK